MKKLIYLLSFAFILFSGCSGFLYTSQPGLQFSEIDYGFPVKKILNNPSISYIDVGKGEHTIILVHGLASNAGFWRYNIPELAKKYRVIAVDLPGYGKSEKSRKYSYKMSFFADQIKRLIDELKLEKVIYVGHSMGGQIGIIFSIKYPQNVEKLVLASPAGMEQFKNGEGEWLANALTVNGVKKTPEDGARKNLAGNFYSWNDKWEWMVEERVRMAKADEFEEFCYAVTRSVKGMIDEPTYNKLSKIKAPTCIIHGKYDGLIPNPYLHPGFSEDIFKYGQSQINGSERHQIDNCGHLVQIEKPEEFNNIVMEFLSK
jgi:pimeloyl-ACP methyl ester carboxylesterase